MGLLYDIHTIVEVARLYYSDGLLQQNIAKKLNISRPYVSLLLTKAKELGIVEISIKNPYESNKELNKDMEDTFNIKQCITIDVPNNNNKIATSIVACQAAALMKTHINNESNIGLASGSMVYNIVESYDRDISYKSAQVYPLIGEINIADYSLLNGVVRDFARKINANWNIIYAPYIVPDIKDKEIYLQSSDMKLLREKWKNLDIAIMGICFAPHKNPYFIDLYKSKKYELSEKSVGNICAMFYDIEGNILDHDINDYIISIDKEALKSAKIKIAAACGSEKIESILGALKTGLIDILVVDESTSIEVLNLNAKLFK